MIRAYSTKGGKAAREILDTNLQAHADEMYKGYNNNNNDNNNHNYKVFQLIVGQVTTRCA